MSSIGTPPGKVPYMAGVFLISFALLVFQIIQTRILSVIAWYYLAFFGISMAMLGMTAGAVYVYLRREHFDRENLGAVLSRYSLLSAICMPASLMVQFSLVISISASVTTVVAWSLLMAAMAVPYIAAGVVISLALTRSPFPVSQVYGVDLLGAALGCVLVILLLNVLDAPSAIIVAGAAAAFAAWCFSVSIHALERAPLWRRPGAWTIVLLALALLNSGSVLGLRPILVKNTLERLTQANYEKWNSFSRIIALPPELGPPWMWGPAPAMPKTYQAQQVQMNIDGLAGTTMFQYDGTPKSIEFLRYDLVNLAYNLPNLHKGAVIGVGGGRDIMSAHLHGVQEITGVELNPIFIDLHENHPFYRDFSNLTKLPGLQLHVDDARSWFASTRERFDVIQMSMIDTWASTGAGAFSLSENGLYTLEGWRAFFNTLTENGVFTVSRWYSPGNVDETGRMISLAAATVLDRGEQDARPYMFVANGDKIATLILSKRPFTDAQLHLLRREVDKLGFKILLAPDQPAASPLLSAIAASSSVQELNRVADAAYLDLSVPTDNRPFFFNQLKLSRMGDLVREKLSQRDGVMFGNLLATVTLMLILVLSMLGVIVTILLPLRSAARDSSPSLVRAGTVYFFLIGLGFMLAEISMLQHFSVFLGHPIYALGVCLFSLILATGLGSLASGAIDIGAPRAWVLWGLITAGYLFGLQAVVPDVFQATTDQPLFTRIAISVALIAPAGFLMGFAFPTGMRLVSVVDAKPAPWFWGINGATGVLASVLALVISMNLGINVTLMCAALCYLVLIFAGAALIKLGRAATRA